MTIATCHLSSHPLTDIAESILRHETPSPKEIPWKIIKSLGGWDNLLPVEGLFHPYAGKEKTYATRLLPPLADPGAESCTSKASFFEPAPRFQSFLIRPFRVLQSFFFF